MKLYYDRRLEDINKRVYYVQQSYRNSEGKSTTKNIARLGKHVDLLKFYDDPLEYAKKVVEILNKEGNIDEDIQMVVNINLAERIDTIDAIVPKTLAYNIGYLYPLKIYHELRIKKFMDMLEQDSRVTYDCNRVASLLIIDRIINAQSKLATYRTQESFYGQEIVEYQHMLRFMDLLEENFLEFQRFLYKQSNNIVPRSDRIMYFDITNFFNEIEREDSDYVDEETGEIIDGLRRYGVSKEHRPNPIVQVGLFVDGDMIPVAISVMPGDTSEQLMAVPLEREVVKMVGGNEPLLYCSDAGCGSLQIRLYNDMQGRSFIITQSIKKLSKIMKEAVFNDSGYRLISDPKCEMSLEFFKTFDRHDPVLREKYYEDCLYKVIPFDYVYDTGEVYEQQCLNGNTRRRKDKAVLKQSLIITFSRKTMEYQRSVRQGQIERARSIIESGDPEQVKKGPHDVTRFIKRKSKGKDGKKAVDTFSLDETRIKNEEKYDGLYGIVTNITGESGESGDLSHKEVMDILRIHAGRAMIEDKFRTTKSHLDLRPVFHHLPNRIKCHAYICYTSLLILSLMERKLELCCETHLTTSQLIETLRTMKVTDVFGGLYKSLYTGSEATKALREAFGLDLGYVWYNEATLQSFLKKFLR